MSELEARIAHKKAEKNAVILAHYYVDGAVQAIADYVGDSYYLSQKAAETDASVLVFCGVKFMGESAKILNPDKTVVMADFEADCPMAHMVTPERIEEVRRTHDDLAVVCYINSTAEIKAHSDVCVTSSNALTIVRALPQKNIFFVPDQNLARHIADQLPEKHFIYNDGYCPIHHVITAEDVLRAKAAHPGAPVLIHPECPPDVCALGDYVGATSGIIKAAEGMDADEFIVCTETGVFWEMERRMPGKKFYPVRSAQICPDMKLITLEKIAHVLDTLENAVELPADITGRAAGCLIKMHELA